MSRTAAKHPLIAGMVLMLGHAGILVATVALVQIAASDTVHRYTVDVLWVTGGLLSVGIGCWLTMLRRRSGQSAWPVCWLVLIAPLQVYLQTIAIVLCAVLSMGPPGALLALVTDARFYAMYVNFPPTMAPIPGILLGVFIGQGVARVMFHSGRWEHIVAVEMPRRRDTTPEIIARHPLIASAVLMCPGIQYAWLLLEPSVGWYSDAAILGASFLYLVLNAATAFCVGVAVAHARQRSGATLGHLPTLMPLSGVVASIAYVGAASLLRVLSYPSVDAGFFFGELWDFDSGRGVFVFALLATLIAMWRGILAAGRFAGTTSAPGEGVIEEP